MTFPDIPDMDLNSINKEEAVDMLLNWAVLEENCLCELIKAEIKIANYVSGQEKRQNAGEINKSIDQSLKNMSHLHLLLQLKIERIQELLPKTVETASSPSDSQAQGENASTVPSKSKAGHAPKMGSFDRIGLLVLIFICYGNFLPQSNIR